jgi:CRP/FNR family cyclic AMP-dependent transcriptional regulator
MERLDPLIRSHPFWDGLNPHYFQILREHASLVKFGIDQPIFHVGLEANFFYLISTGRVALETFVSGKGAITIETLVAGEALGWSWLFPPYRWHFSAHSVDVTEAVAFNAQGLRSYAQENFDFGYQMSSRVGREILQRLQATRLQLVEGQALTAE